MAIRINGTDVSTREWAGIDKRAIANRIEREVRAGSAGVAVINEYYALVGDGATRGRSGDEGFRLIRRLANLPHHLIVRDELVVNEGGVIAARNAVAGARTPLQPPPGSSLTDARSHLNRHLRLINRARRERGQAPLEPI